MQSKNTMILAAGVVAALAGSAMAGGIIRDIGVSSAGHSALSIQSGIFSYSTTPSAANYYGAANPVVLTAVPNSQAPSSSSSNGFYNPDVAANPTTSSAYGSNWLSSNTFYLSANSSGTAVRNAVYSTTNGFGTATEGSSLMPSSYSGNTFRIQYGDGTVASALGTGNTAFAGSYRALVTQTTRVIDGGTAGVGQIVNLFTVTRLITGSSASDSGNITFNVGYMADVAPGGAGVTSSSILANTAAEKRIRLSNTTGFAEVVGYGATSFKGGNRSASAGADNLNNSTNLASSGNLANTLAASSSASAVGLVWKFNLAAGESFTYAVGISYNTTAIPAPGAAALLGMGGLLAARRRR
jgi:hypothetical protein